MKAKYGINETSTTFSFKPHTRIYLHIYLPLIGVLSALTGYFIHSENEAFLIVSASVLIVVVCFFAVELLIYRPIRYTFDRINNAVYLSNLFFSEKKLMNLDEVIIFRSSEMGAWHYKMGKKKSHFIKNYQISENFDFEANNYKLAAYRKELLEKIETFVTLARLKD